VASLTPARGGAVKVGRRTNLAACSSLARPHLDGFEHNGTAWCGRDDDQRGARFRARFNRATTLYSVGPRTQTMMQSYASVAKLRSGGPILPFGMKAKGPGGIPPPRTVIGVPSQAYGRGRNCLGSFSALRSLGRTQNDAIIDRELLQRLARPCRQWNSRSKRTNELTSSIVPRGTSFHRSVELAFSPIVIVLARLSCHCGLPSPLKLGTVNLYAVHDHGEAACSPCTRLRTNRENLCPHFQGKCGRQSEK
jgi:hypothetical protein